MGGEIFLNANFTTSPYVEFGAEYQLLVEVEQNTEASTEATEDTYQLIQQQYHTQQACFAVQIFLLAALLGAICAKGLFRW